MSDRPQDIDARLERLRTATEPVRPRADFAARVAGAVARDGTLASRDWTFDLSRAARRLLPVAAMAAALGLVWAVQSARSADEALTASNTAELDAEW